MKNIMNNEQSNLIERIQAVNLKLASLVDQGEDVETDEYLCAKSDEWLDKEILLDEEVVVDYCDHINCDCREEIETSFGLNKTYESPEELSEFWEDSEISEIAELLDRKEAAVDKMFELCNEWKAQLDGQHKVLDDCLGELMNLAKEIESYAVSINKN